MAPVREPVSQSDGRSVRAPESCKHPRAPSAPRFENLGHPRSLKPVFGVTAIRPGPARPSGTPCRGRSGRVGGGEVVGAAAMPNRTASTMARPSRIAQAMPAAMASPQPIGLTTSSARGRAKTIDARPSEPDGRLALGDHDPFRPAGVERPHGASRSSSVSAAGRRFAAKFLPIRLDDQRLEVEHAEQPFAAEIEHRRAGRPLRAARDRSAGVPLGSEPMRTATSARAASSA